ncbi:ficolin-2-like [Aplysia californica]|uniref:Ficolin-2-like n=1 Tax=Aplysia californica TaxID=6500 RepID=A0ABM1W1J5_APLCA|nr:ficolin-2-like [Aplysia californica]
MAICRSPVLCVILLTTLSTTVRGARECIFMTHRPYRSTVSTTSSGQPSSWENNFSKDISRGRSQIDCAVQCGLSDACLGVRWAVEKKECHLYRLCNNNSDDVCEEPDLGGNSGTPRFLMKVRPKINPCRNNGSWEVEVDAGGGGGGGGGRCSCRDGWVGTWCGRRPSSCGELKRYRYPNGFYSLLSIQLPRHPGPIIQVRCDLLDFQAYTFIFKNRGTTSKNLSWTEYVDGFYQDEMNFWFGLENMHKFTDSGHNYVYLEYVFTYDWNYNADIYKYSGFKIGDASSSYSVSVEGSEFSLVGEYNKTSRARFRDCIRFINGTRFSTVDKDNDDNRLQSCASIRQTGWWFKSVCNLSCNLLGLTYKVTDLNFNQDSHIGAVLSGSEAMNNYPGLTELKKHLGAVVMYFVEFW